MSRITKEIAKCVANKLTEKRKIAVDKKYKEFQVDSYEAYKKKIPKDVLEFYATHKTWVKEVNQYQLIGHGWNHEYVYMSDMLPSKDGNYIHVSLDEKTSKALLLKSDYVKDERQKIEVLKDEIENALVRLGTYKRVKEQFSEAYLLLSAHSSQALVVNVDKIREKL
jgi:hypothetical protein